MQVGVIDCLQAFTLGKRVESVAKSLLHAVRGGGYDADISAVEPGTYARRFLRMARRVFPLEAKGK